MDSQFSIGIIGINWCPSSQYLFSYCEPSYRLILPIYLRPQHWNYACTVYPTPLVNPRLREKRDRAPSLFAFKGVMGEDEVGFNASEYRGMDESFEQFDEVEDDEEEEEDEEPEEAGPRTWAKVDEDAVRSHRWDTRCDVADDSE